MSQPHQSFFDKYHWLRRGLPGSVIIRGEPKVVYRLKDLITIKEQYDAYDLMIFVNKSDSPIVQRELFGYVDSSANYPEITFRDGDRHYPISRPNDELKTVVDGLIARARQGSCQMMLTASFAVINQVQTAIAQGILDHERVLIMFVANHAVDRPEEHTYLDENGRGTYTRFYQEIHIMFFQQNGLIAIPDIADTHPAFDQLLFNINDRITR